MKTKNIELTDVEQLCDAILKYNITIETTSGVIETNQFNLVQFLTSEAGLTNNNICENAQKDGSIILAYNPKGAVKIGVNELNKDTKVVVIPYSTIKSFRIQGKRNFLLNQVDIQKGRNVPDRLETLERKVENNLPKFFHHSNRKGGKLDIPTNDGTCVIEWHEISQNFGSGGNNFSAQINLDTTMSEIHSVQITGMASGPGGSGGVWDHPHFQASIINQNQKTIQIMASKGGDHTLHLLVFGKK